MTEFEASTSKRKYVEVQIFKIMCILTMYGPMLAQGMIKAAQRKDIDSAEDRFPADLFLRIFDDPDVLVKLGAELRTAFTALERSKVNCIGCAPNTGTAPSRSLFHDPRCATQGQQPHTGVMRCDGVGERLFEFVRLQAVCIVVCTCSESHLNHQCVQEFFPTLAAIERGVGLTLQKHGNRIRLVRSTAQENEEVCITCS